MNFTGFDGLGAVGWKGGSPQLEVHQEIHRKFKVEWSGSLGIQLIENGSGNQAQLSFTTKCFET